MATRSLVATWNNLMIFIYYESLENWKSFREQKKIGLKFPNTSTLCKTESYSLCLYSWALASLRVLGFPPWLKIKQQVCLGCALSELVSDFLRTIIVVGSLFFSQPVIRDVLAGQGEGRSLVISAHWWAGEALWIPGFVYFHMAMNKWHWDLYDKKAEFAREAWI